MKICTQNAQHAPCRITRLAVFSVHVLFLFGLVAVIKLWHEKFRTLVDKSVGFIFCGKLNANSFENLMETENKRKFSQNILRQDCRFYTIS